MTAATYTPRHAGEPADPDAAPIPADRSQRIRRDSILLVASYGLTAMVGLAFWALAARTIPAARLGVDTALISAITAAATIAGTGLSNAFLALLPHAGRGRGPLLREGYLIGAVAALGSGLGAGLLVVAVLPGIHSPVWAVLAVMIATLVWTFFVVQDPVLTASGRAGWLLIENLPVNVAKLAMLPLLASATGTGAHPAVVAMVVPAAVAVLVVSGFLVPRLVRQGQRGDDLGESAGTWMLRYRREFRLFVLRDGLASALGLGAYLVLPFIVTAVAGPVDGAVFAVCLQLSAGLDLVTAGAGVALTTNVATDLAGGPKAAVALWLQVIRLLVPAAVLLVVGSPVILFVFGPEYLHHDGVAIMAVLAVGSVLRSTFEVWTALVRAQRRTGLLLKCNVAGAVLLLALVVGLARADGAVGAAVGVTLATCVFSAVGALGLRRGVAGPGSAA